MRESTSLAKAPPAFRRVTRAAWTARVGLCLGISLFSQLQAAEDYPRQWSSIAGDGLHDPKSAAAKMLQQPREALQKLSPDTAGNQVRWVQALDKKEIQPREKFFPQTEIRKLDKDIILNLKGGMPAVRFPHRQHTEWLDCVNCHDSIFAAQTGGTKISMFKILQGEQCGICHGAVAFPLTECSRCHSILRPGEQKLVIPADADRFMHQAPKAGP